MFDTSAGHDAWPPSDEVFDTSGEDTLGEPEPDTSGDDTSRRRDTSPRAAVSPCGTSDKWSTSQSLSRASAPAMASRTDSRAQGSIRTSKSSLPTPCPAMKPSLRPVSSRSSTSGRAPINAPAAFLTSRIRNLALGATRWHQG